VGFGFRGRLVVGGGGGGGGRGLKGRLLFQEKSPHTPSKNPNEVYENLISRFVNKFS